MSDQKQAQPEPTKPEPTAPQSKVACGLDVGTMNLVCTRSDTNQSKITRNVFLKLDNDAVNISEMSNISYVQSDDSDDVYIIGNDAFQFANIFAREVSRPMESGLISPKEIDAIDVLTLMIKDLIGDVKNKEVFCSYSIPAEAIDRARSVTYHEKIFGRVLSSLGINHSPVNEAMAIVYSECAKENYSGIAISLGAGMANTCVAYKGIEALTFSTARSGDWIDKNVAESLNIIQNRVTSIKEKKFDLIEGYLQEKNKKTKRALEALTFYYNSLIDYTIKEIIKQFDEKVDIEIDEALPIIVSGGTSLPNGFIEMFSENIRKYDLPFELSEIRRASDPLTAVANGLLVKTMSDIK